MTPVEMSTALKKRWIQRWPTAVAACGYEGAVPPHQFPNDVKPDVATYARVGITHVGSDQWTLGGPGNRKFERMALIDVRLVGPINVGDGPLYQLAKAVSDVYEAVRFGHKIGRDNGIVTHAMQISELRRDPESAASWLLSLTTPFEYYETK